MQPPFYKFLLMERTKPHVFLAPTKITFSSYNWVIAPTSTCTGFNILQLQLSESTKFHLYREYNMLFLAPPYHPCFSDLKWFSTICRKIDITMHTNSVIIYLWICFCTLAPLIVSILYILERTHIPLSFCNPHFDDDPCTSSLPAENAPISLHAPPLKLINH